MRLLWPPQWMLGAPPTIGTSDTAPPHFSDLLRAIVNSLNSFAYLPNTTEVFYTSADTSREMLGAQALRTKQKAEQKEKEKRQRERLRSLELQRDKLHKAACEDAAAQYLEITANPPLKASKHRHSVHSSTMPQLQINAPTFDKSIRTNGQLLKSLQVGAGPQRSTSSEHCREERRDTISSSSRFLKWLGIGGGSDKKDLKHRRMSTFT